MAKIFLTVFKQADAERAATCKLKGEQMMHLLCPDHITPSVKMEIDDSHCLFLFNERNNVHYKNFSVCTGVADVPITGWWQNLDMNPSASLLIVTDIEKCTIQSNLVASRCVWYYKDDEQFIVSTSQRAIVAWLGSFESNPQAVSWMLSTGNLGPGNAWDKRIQHLSAGSKVVLDCKEWSITKSSLPIKFENKGRSMKVLRQELEQHLDKVFSEMKIELPFTALSLSGGYDSRTVLYFMVKHGLLVPTATWGLLAALNERNTDAYAAKALADKLGVPHRFYATDFSEYSFELVFDRFVKAGEGRLDHINTFMDGFRMWKNMSESGIRQVIRADEVFGWLPAQTEQDVRISLDMHSMNDHANMLPIEMFGMEAQYYPPEYLRRDGETLEGWRDRLYRQFRLPYVLSALHDLVHPYVEIINPFLHRDIITFCSEMPDDLRTQKKLYAETVTHLIPNVPIARKASIPEPGAIFRYARVMSVMLDELGSEEAKSVMGTDFLQALPAHLVVDDMLINRTNNSLDTWLKSAIPWQIKKLLRKDLVKYRGDFNQLAFRASVVSRMHRLLAEDARVFNKMSLNNHSIA